MDTIKNWIHEHKGQIASAAAACAAASTAVSHPWADYLQAVAIALAALAGSALPPKKS